MHIFESFKYSLMNRVKYGNSQDDFENSVNSSDIEMVKWMKIDELNS